MKKWKTKDKNEKLRKEVNEIKNIELWLFDSQIGKIAIEIWNK